MSFPPPGRSTNRITNRITHRITTAACMVAGPPQRSQSILLAITMAVLLSPFQLIKV
jgi:hypothetical protein